MSIIIFIIILAILILVHEFGHFLVAKKFGIRVDEFGLGFPPKIFAKKWGETTYTLNAIPFGGFVKIFGEDPVVETDLAENTPLKKEDQFHYRAGSQEDRDRSFQFKSKWIQSAVLVAGVTFNIIFAWLCISLGLMIGLPASADYSSFGKTTNPNLVITEVLPDSPAKKAGLISGDIVLSASSGDVVLQNETLTPDNVKNLISAEATKEIEVVYRRGSNLPVSVLVEPAENLTEGKKIIGIGMDNVGILKLSPHFALLEGVRTTYFLTKATVIGLSGFLWDAINFRSDFSQVAGPVGIAKVVGEANDLGFVYLLSLIALISINLAVINLLPFPALDGGRLLFVGIEAIIRRSIKPVIVQWVNGIGFVLLILLMLVITGHDILNLF